MAVNIKNTDRFKFNNVYYKLTGEYLNDRLKGFFLVLPKIALVATFFFFLFAFSGIGLVSELFFLLALFFVSLNILFVVLMLIQKSDIACMGVIDEARSSQINYIFGIGKKAKDKIKYYADVGCVVYEFLGSNIKEANKNNLLPHNRVYQLLVDKKTYTMGVLLPGSTGSGKTVTFNTLAFLPAIKSGNGFFYIEGKGDRPITEGILAFIYQYGRENDVYILDFGAAASGGNTNGLNPLAIGSSKTVGELLKSLIDVMKGDNKWVSDMAIAFLEALLLPLVLLRDMGLVIDSKHLKEIKKFSDFERFDKKQFNITALLNYLSFQAAIDLYYMMNRMLKDDAFLHKVSQIPEYGNLRKDLVENIAGRLKRNLTGHNIDISSVTEPDYSKIDEQIKRNHPKATEDWINALEIFGSEKFYGNIFNKDEADFETLTAMQTGKIIIAIIPSMSASKEQCEKMGKMMTAIAKSSIGYMLEKGDLVGTLRQKSRNMRYRPRKLPYGHIYDEPSNYANADIPQMSSMVRSVGSDNGGQAIFFSGQSKSDADKIGEHESSQLFANLGFTLCLNIQDKGYKEVMVEKTGKERVARESMYNGKKSTDEDLHDLKNELEDKYQPNYFENDLLPQTGSAIVHIKGHAKEEKVVTWYNEAPKGTLFINVNISSKKLLNKFKNVEEAQEELNALKKKLEAEAGEAENSQHFVKKSFEQEVKEGLMIIVSRTYPALENGYGYDFTLSLLDEVNPRAHGDYNSATRHINIYNSINKSREHLLATAIHELAHHVDYGLNGSTGHGRVFYGILFELIQVGMGVKELMFDYQEAKEKKMIDSNDIRMMEGFFGVPTPKIVEAA